MSRFKHPASVAGLSDLLTRAVKAKPHAVILLDEIEKAHHEVQHLLLQLLDEGRLTDSRQRQVDFTNTIIMLTTNSRDVQHDFASEVLIRLNAVYTYNKLDTTTATRLVNKQLAEFNRILQGNSIIVSLSEAAIEVVAQMGYNQKLGAREIARKFEKLIKHPLTQGIIQGVINNGNDYHIDLQRDSSMTINATIIANDEVVFELSMPTREQGNSNERLIGFR